MNESPKKILVVGGVAAGASFAARARRHSEIAEITLIERGPDVSFANCGLPYYIGGEIPGRDALAVQTPQTLKSMLNLEVRTRTEAVEVDVSGKRLKVRSLADGEEEWLPYDTLMLAPGAKSMRPPIPGIEDPRIRVLRNLEDMDAIKEDAATANRACVIGAGFIGLEMAEQLHRLGIGVTLVELQEQVLPPLDREMALLVESELRQNGVDLVLGDGIARFESATDGLHCQLASGKSIPADLVVLSIGVQPDTALARTAGLELGPRGHIVVDEFQRTSAPGIYAGGDAVVSRDRVFGESIAVPLGGPANRQGRVAADHLFLGGKALPYPGSLGTAIVRVFTVAAGLTGWSEKRLEAAGRPFKATLVNDNHHAGYFPGARPLTLKVLWDPEDGRLLGAQATGFEGVDKRIDILATAIAGGMTVEDLCHLELSYAPPFGSAKDLVNIAGFTATNQRDGLVETVFTLPQDGAQVVDVRPKPLAQSHPLPGSINIPFPELRSRLNELDRDQPVVTVCAFGKMSYFASRILRQNGFQVRSFAGGIKGTIDPRTPAKLPTA